MPVIKIANPVPELPEETNIPWFNQKHVLILPETHLTQKTRHMLKNEPETLPPCGGGLFSDQHDEKNYVNDIITHYDIVYFTSNADIGELPHDLQACVIFAANHGFTEIWFRPYDKEDCPTTPYLQTYK